jgi:hypothetical protein
MLTYLTILAASLCGYTAMPTWTVVAATVALVSLTMSEHYGLYKRGTEVGLFRQVDETFLRSAFNALCAAGGAYLCGVAVRYIAAI